MLQMFVYWGHAQQRVEQSADESEQNEFTAPKNLKTCLLRWGVNKEPFGPLKRLVQFLAKTNNTLRRQKRTFFSVHLATYFWNTNPILNYSGLENFGDQSLDGFDYNELESIDLSWNELTQVPQVVLKLGKLRHLDLSHNKIFSLPPGSSFNNLNALATLKLGGNKWVI